MARGPEFDTCGLGFWTYLHFQKHCPKTRYATAGILKKFGQLDIDCVSFRKVPDIGLSVAPQMAERVKWESLLHALCAVRETGTEIWE